MVFSKANPGAAANARRAVKAKFGRCGKQSTPTKQTMTPGKLSKPKDDPLAAISPSVQSNEAERRTAIKVIFCSLGCPSRSEWGRGEDGLVQKMMTMTGACRQAVERELSRLVQAEKDNKNVESSERKRGSGGGNRRVEAGTRQADILVGGYIGGFGSARTTRMVNASLSPAENPVSASTVHRTKVRLGGKTRRRPRTKTGSKDRNSKWAKARLAVCSQFQEQVRLGSCSAEEQAKSEFPPPVFGWHFVG